MDSRQGMLWRGKETTPPRLLYLCDAPRRDWIVHFNRRFNFISLKPALNARHTSEKKSFDTSMLATDIDNLRARSLRPKTDNRFVHIFNLLTLLFCADFREEKEHYAR